MTFSSAYLFARQISAGQSPIQSNIIYDNSQFNLSRMPSNFDFVNNLTRCPESMGVENARTAILGGYLHDNIGDGSILAGYSTGSPEMILESDSFSHVGESVYPTQYGTVYFIPIVMRTLSEEGYSSFKVTASGNAVGIPGAYPQTSGGSLYVSVCYANGTGLSRFDSVSTDYGYGTEVEIESTKTINLSSYGSYTPAYVEIFAMNGTARVKKLWFE